MTSKDSILKLQLPILFFNQHLTPLGEFAEEDLAGEHVGDLRLDEAAQGTGAEFGVKTFFSEIPAT